MILKAELLLFDDVHLLFDKEVPLKVMKDSIRVLCDDNKQVVLTGSECDYRKSSDFKTLLFDEPMKLRMAEIKRPDYETRVAILHDKLRRMDIEEDDSISGVIKLIAENRKDDIRNMEGALNKVIVISDYFGLKVNEENARKILEI